MSDNQKRARTDLPVDVDGGDTTSSQQRQPQPSSKLLDEILRKEGLTKAEFFDTIWQKEAKVFAYSKSTPRSVPLASESGAVTWNDELMQQQPLDEIVRQSWNILSDLLQTANEEQLTHIINSNPSSDFQRPIIFQNLAPQDPERIQSTYGNSLFHPYLDGNSIVLNHGDLLSPWIAAMCQDLQNSFPHAYANCYITPPNSQTAPPHADDRDVLIFQVVGSKNWKVYSKIPIPYPYPHEQVGKEGLEVPPDVLKGPLGISTTLYPGDVLYMPRGFVHEASCSEQHNSFHITVALATHDWTLAGIFSLATQQLLTTPATPQSLEYRKSLLPTCTDPSVLQTHVDDVFDLLKERITGESILQNLSSKMENHNRRAFTERMRRIHKARFPITVSENAHPIDCVGPNAAGRVTFQSVIRAATPEEKARVVENAFTTNGEPRGLNVREAIGDSIATIVSGIKLNPTQSFRVVELRSLLSEQPNPLVCDLTLLCLVKRCVELGAVAVV